MQIYVSALHKLPVLRIAFAGIFVARLFPWSQQCGPTCNCGKNHVTECNNISMSSSVLAAGLTHGCKQSTTRPLLLSSHDPDPPHHSQTKFVMVESWLLCIPGFPFRFLVAKLLVQLQRPGVPPCKIPLDKCVVHNQTACAYVKHMKAI